MAADPAPDTDVARFVERLGTRLTEAGMARLPARIFAALLADDDGRMTAAELAEELDVSRASVSGGVGYLIRAHWVHRERERGSRRDVYAVLDDAWHEAMISGASTYQPVRAVLADGVRAVGGPGTAPGRRLATSVAFLEFLSEEMLGVARRWEERRAALAGPSQPPLPGRPRLP